MINTVGSVKINWLLFWQRLSQHADWSLEWFNGSAWVNVKSDLTVQKSFPKEDTCKIKLLFTASEAGNYRLTFAADEEVRKYTAKLDKYQYELEYRDHSLIFDWSDVIGIPNLVITHGLKDVGGAKYFWFRIARNNVPKGASLELDPSLVATTSVCGTGVTEQRLTFYAAGYYWCFYTDGTNLVYKKSLDGADWSGAPVTVRACTDRSDFDVQFFPSYSATYVYYVYANRVNAMYYRRGTIGGSPLTITWGTEYNAASGYAYAWTQPTVCVDHTDGRAHVVATVVAGGNSIYWALSNPNNDGSGAWASHGSMRLQAGGGAFSGVIVPLTSCRVFMLYNYAATLYYRLWDEVGTHWDAEAGSISTTNQLFCAVANGDDIHLVYEADYANTIRYRKYVYGTGWGAAETVVTVDVGFYNASGPTVCYDAADDVVYCFWKYGSNGIKYKSRVAGVWGSEQTLVSGETGLLNVSISPFKIVWNVGIGVAWSKGSFGTYYVMYVVLSLLLPPALTLRRLLVGVGL